MHSLLEQGKISKATVDEFDKASAGLKLPERAPKARRGRRAQRKGARGA